MMNQNTNNNGNRNTALETALAGIIAECKNIVKLSELEKLAIGTSCEGDYICCTVDITEQLQQAKAEVERLESVISECEEAKAKQEAQANEKKKAEEKFISSLTNSEREALAYLEGLQVLASGENERLIATILEAYRKYTNSVELVITANIAAYTAILIKEERREVIDLLETVTVKMYNIQKASKRDRPDVRLDGLVRILTAIQDLY